MPLDSDFLKENKAQQEAVTDYLHQMFFGLLDSMFQQIRENTQTKPAKLSYNFVMTHQFMLLVPRSKECGVVQHNGTDVVISVNSLGFAGFLLAKTAEQRDALEGTDLFAFLRQVALPWANETD